jgi:hypothetical protein
MAMVREQDVFFVAGPALDYTATLWRSGASAQRIRPLLVVGSAAAAFAACLAPQLAAYQALNGRFSPSPLVGRKMTWSSPHALQVLLSPEHGFFFWTPLAAIAIGGLALLALSTGAREKAVPAGSRQIAVCLIVMVAAAIYVTGSVESWTAAGAFGQRRFVSLTPVLTVGLAAAIAHVAGAAKARPGPAAAAAVVVALSVWWNLALIAQFGARMMDRQRMELARNARAAFITLPVAGPRLVYRYVFDRESFYEPSPGR